MDNQELRKLLEQLQNEIEHTQTIDNNGRQLLQNLETDINELLERSESGPLSQPHPSTLSRLEDSINYFELSHPNLTSQLTKLLSILSNAGI